ncbi:MAG: trypsin-like peptidase domain-containing protein, partial [Thermomicrobium sp.]|nr:trypsin-like peptidase domain-containing protein [Thermomicrobium sp.]
DVYKRQGQVYQRVGKAVVDVIASSSNGFFDEEGSGSGVVIDERGLIVTAAHVVSGASTVEVKFATGERASARVLGVDEANDLALLQVDRLPEGIPVAPLGDSDTVQVGDVVVAIGSPFGLSGTVTQGIVSAVDRSWSPPGDRLRSGLIQTDAPINPGNSGGPLFNANGEVIGIATMIESPIRGNVGIGFAVPSNTVKRVLPQLEQGAQLQPAWLGISGTDLDADTARRFGLPVEQGVIVLNVVPGSPAARSGLRPAQIRGNDIAALGDVIVALDGEPVRGMQDLAARIGAHQPGDTVELTIVRDGQQQTLRVTLGSWPQQG